MLDKECFKIQEQFIFSKIYLPLQSSRKMEIIKNLQNTKETHAWFVTQPNNIEREMYLPFLRWDPRTRRVRILHRNGFGIQLRHSSLLEEETNSELNIMFG